MNCSVCGAMIPDGQAVCPNCGTAVQPMYGQPQQPQQPMYGQPQQPMYGQPQQPQQPMYGQPQQPMYGQPQQPMYGQPQQPMYQQPMYGQPQQTGGIGAYFSNLPKDPMNILRIVGAVFLLIAPLFPCAAAKIFGIKAGSTNLWGGGVLALISALLITAVAAWLICVELADYVPALSKVKLSIPYAELIALGVVLVLVLLNTFIFKLSESGEKISMSEIRDYGYKVSYGFGYFFTWISVVLCAVPRFIKKK